MLYGDGKIISFLIYQPKRKTYHLIERCISSLSDTDLRRMIIKEKYRLFLRTCLKGETIF